MLRLFVFKELRLRTLVVYTFGALAAFAIIGVVIGFTTPTPAQVAYWVMLYGAFGTKLGLSEIGVRFTTMLLLGLGVGYAMRCGLWNIGAEGQMYMGALATAVLALTFPEVSAAMLIPLVFVASFLAGASWGFVPGFLKAKLEVNEIITTLMMNFIIISFTQYLLLEPMRGTVAEIGYEPQTNPITYAARLPRFIVGARLHAGIFIAVIAILVVYFILRKTSWGYQVKAVGANPEAARYAGINVSRTMMISMAVAGGLAGLAGWVEVSGVYYYMRADWSPGYGYIAIIVALLGRGRPFGVALAAFFFSFLMVGGDAMQALSGVEYTIIYMLQALVLLFVLATETWVIGRRDRR